MNGFTAQHPEMVNGEMQNDGMKNAAPVSFTQRFVVVLILIVLFEVWLALSGAQEVIPAWLMSPLRIGLGIICGAWMFEKAE